MENTTSSQPQVGGNNTGLFLGIGLFVAFIVIGYLIYKSKNPTVTEPNSTIKPDDKPVEPEKPKTQKCYKRTPTDFTFDLAQESDYKYYFDTMRNKGWSEEVAVYGAAFLKGMDLPINTHFAPIYKKDIQDFVKNTPAIIKKKATWVETVISFPYLPNDLVCDVTTLSQPNVTPRRRGTVEPPQ